MQIVRPARPSAEELSMLEFEDIASLSAAPSSRGSRLSTWGIGIAVAVIGLALLGSSISGSDVTSEPCLSGSEGCAVFGP